MVYASSIRDNSPKRKMGILKAKQSPTAATPPKTVSRGGILISILF